MTYWVDEPRGAVFCLIDAPDKSTVEQMHKNAHGLMPHKILEVSNELVQSFLGRIHDPLDAVMTDKGLKVFSDPAHRVLLVTDEVDRVLLRHRLGQEGAERILTSRYDSIHIGASKHNGRVVEHGGGGWVISFPSAAGAVACALDIAPQTTQLAISSGDPVENSDKFFGDALQLAKRLCSLQSGGKIALSISVRNLFGPDLYPHHDKQLSVLTQKDESLMTALSDMLEKHGQDQGFGVEQFGRTSAMSKSQLYRKTMELWAMAPNDLLRRFRLDKARELLRNQAASIAGVGFDCGFTSPSYFAKCFKDMFGIPPATYQQMI